MSYYDTMDEDLKRAREILARGKAEPRDLAIPDHVSFGGTIYGADIYAAYKLIESFVGEIETQRANVQHLLDTCVPVVELEDVRAELKAAHASEEAAGEGWREAIEINKQAQAEIARLREDRDFWDRKAGEEHAKVIELERQADVLRTLIPLPDTMVPEGELVDVQNAHGEALAEITRLKDRVTHYRKLTLEFASLIDDVPLEASTEPESVLDRAKRWGIEFRDLKHRMRGLEK